MHRENGCYRTRPMLNMLGTIRPWWRELNLMHSVSLNSVGSKPRVQDAGIRMLFTGSRICKPSANYRKLITRLGWLDLVTSAIFRAERLSTATLDIRDLKNIDAFSRIWTWGKSYITDQPPTNNGEQIASCWKNLPSREMARPGWRLTNGYACFPADLVDPGGNELP